MQIPAAAAFSFGHGEIMPHGMKMRVNLQSTPKTNRGFTKFPQRHMAQSLSRCCAEMIRVALQSLLAISHRAGEIFSHEAHGRAFVPTFGKSRRHDDEPGKRMFGVLEPALLHGIHTNPKDEIGFSVARLTP